LYRYQEGDDLNHARMLLVHGAFHGGWCWQKLLPALRARAVEADAVDLPLTSLVEDVEAVSQVMERADRPLVVVGHSYGGAVITAAGLAGSGRRPADHLVYLAALMHDPAEDLHLAPTAAMTAVRLGEDGTAVLDPAQAATSMYNRCAPDVVSWAVSKLRPMRFGAEASNRPEVVAWRTIPSTYIVCTDDCAIDPVDQRRMAEQAAERIELDADHSPFLSKVEELADILSGVARSAPLAN
jgi:pimeloyl-ACP methyl ester carboxylesterase